MMRLLIVLIAALISACSSVPSVKERTQQADSLAQQSGWSKKVIKTDHFDLMSYQSAPGTSGTLNLVIEGDGLAFLSKRQPSTNPTPVANTALKIALTKPQKHTTVYLARPCQFITGKHCRTNKYWTSGRFALPVLDSLDQALTQLVDDLKPKKIVITGYSGGAALAVMVSARRKDVSEIITYAGNIDHVAWAHYHKLSPLKDSLDTIDYVFGVKYIPQTHYFGALDKNTTPYINQRYFNALSVKPTIVVKEDVTHACCW